jgi:hypothetical protein
VPSLFAIASSLVILAPPKQGITKIILRARHFRTCYNATFHTSLRLLYHYYNAQVRALPPPYPYTPITYCEIEIIYNNTDLTVVFCGRSLSHPQKDTSDLGSRRKPPSPTSSMPLTTSH